MGKESRTAVSNMTPAQMHHAQCIDRPRKKRTQRPVLNAGKPGPQQLQMQIETKEQQAAQSAIMTLRIEASTCVVGSIMFT